MVPVWAVLLWAFLVIQMLLVPVSVVLFATRIRKNALMLRRYVQKILSALRGHKANSSVGTGTALIIFVIAIVIVDAQMDIIAQIISLILLGEMTLA